MGTQTVELDGKSSNPLIEICIGQAQHGTYRIYLWDSNGQKPVLLGSSTNWDQILDSYNLGPLSELNQKIITWEILVSAAQTGEGQFYSVRVIFKQGTLPVQGGTFTEAGPLQGTKFIQGAVRLTVVN